MKLKALLPYFGGKRTMAPRIVTELGPHSYYFECCAGSMAVLFAKDPSEHETAIDLHGGMTNLAWVCQREETAIELFNRAQRTLYTDEIFEESKAWLAENESRLAAAAGVADPDWAYHYFLCSWMGRNGVAGTERVNYQVATRWTSGGGSGPLRFRNATASIPAWCDRLRNVQILRRDLFDVLPKIDDTSATAIYADPPYLNEGDQYLHSFKAEDHARLALELRRFKKARVVVSYYADPRLAELYPGWTLCDCVRQKHLHNQAKRGMSRKDAPEVLLINGPSLHSDGPARLFA